MTSKGENKGLDKKNLFKSEQDETIFHEVKKSDARKMCEARDILLLNWENPLSLKELAHEVGTNEYHLKKHFKMVFGMTVFNYLYQFIMEKAKEMLTHQDLNIGEIALQLGFKHATHFTASFKKHVGELPKQYRKRVLKTGGNKD